jgi:acyl dehydratase
MSTPVPADGPFYDDLAPGMELEPQPAVTMDVGLAAWYQSIVGEVLPVCLDHRLSSVVTSASAPLASPGLVANLSVGQSTVATRRAIANLFYRNMRILRPVHIGETLHTRIHILAMADATPRPDRPNRGKVLLGMQTTADEELVMDYQRCALLPVRGDTMPGHAGDTGSAPDDPDIADYVNLIPSSWQADALPMSGPWGEGEIRSDVTRDVIDEATGLVRLTHNRAIVHRDAQATMYGQRLVYGGHVQALAQASLTRVEPRLATFVAWHACSHLAPAFEGDLLSFEHRLLAEHRNTDGATVRAYETIGYAHRPASDGDGDEEVTKVLRWVPVAITRTEA